MTGTHADATRAESSGERLEEAQREAATARAALAKRDAEVELMRGELAELRRQLARGEAELADYTELGAKLMGAESSLREYETMLASASWRITGPLRRAASWFRARRS